MITLTNKLFLVFRCPLNPVVSKASSGAMEVMNLSKVKDDQSLLTFLQVYIGHSKFGPYDQAKTLYKLYPLDLISNEI